MLSSTLLLLESAEREVIDLVLIELLLVVVDVDDVEDEVLVVLVDVEAINIRAKIDHIRRLLFEKQIGDQKNTHRWLLSKYWCLLLWLL